MIVMAVADIMSRPSTLCRHKFMIENAIWNESMPKLTHSAIHNFFKLFYSCESLTALLTNVSFYFIDFCAFDIW